MILLRCPKFLRCLTADAGNFDRGHSLTSLPLPLAALSSLPTSARPTALLVMCHCETSDRCHWLWQSVPLAPLPKGGWHGEAVAGRFFSRTPCNPSVGATLAVARPSLPGRAHGPCPTKRLLGGPQYPAAHQNLPTIFPRPLFCPGECAIIS